VDATRDGQTGGLLATFWRPQGESGGRVNASTRQRVKSKTTRFEAPGCAAARQRVKSVFNCSRAPNQSLATGNHNVKPQPGHWNAPNRNCVSTRQRVNAASPGARFPQWPRRRALVASAASWRSSEPLRCAVTPRLVSVGGNTPLVPHSPACLAVPAHTRTHSHSHPRTHSHTQR
jgi:hypothetical protein